LASSSKSRHKKFVILRNEGSSSDDRPEIYTMKKILHSVQDDKDRKIFFATASGTLAVAKAAGDSRILTSPLFS